MTRPVTARAQPKIQRWTDLIAALLRRRFPISFDELAAEVTAYDPTGRRLESVKRTFERDKKELIQFGVPIETHPDDTGAPGLYAIDRKNFYLPYLELVAPPPKSRAAPAASPSKARHGRVDREGYRALQSLAFEPEELALVAAAAERVRSLGDPMLRADAESAMRKLAFDLPVGAAAAPRGEPLVVQPRARAQAALFTVLGDALRARKRVTFAYHGIETDATATRVVEPYGLYYLNGHWYLAGRDTAHGGLRNFRLSRMSDVEANAARESTPDYDVPAGFDLREHARSHQAWELGDGDAVDAEVAFVRHTGATKAAAQLGAAVDGAPDRRRFVVRRPDTFVRWLLSFGGDVRPVSPASLVADYRDVAERTRRLYDATEGGA